MITRSHMVCLLASLMLAACGSSPPVRYFSLTSTVGPAQQQAPGEAVALGLGPLRMPEYLDRSQLVSRMDGSEMRVDDFSRWAEPLDVAVHRVLSADVSSLMPNVLVHTFPWESALHSRLDYRLRGEILRFESDRDGRIVLEVQWGLTSSEEAEPLMPPRRSTYESTARPAGDPAAITTAMNDALGQFSREIADALARALPE